MSDILRDFNDILTIQQFGISCEQGNRLIELCDNHIYHKIAEDLKTGKISVFVLRTAINRGIKFNDISIEKLRELTEYKKKLEVR